MAIGKPILLLGNAPNHITEILDDYDIGWSIKHGDIESMIKVLTYLRDVDRDLLLDKGKNAKKVIVEKFSQKALLKKFCDCIEKI